MSNTALRKIQCTESTEDAMEILAKDGALIISGLLSHQAYADLRNELDPEFAQAGFCKGLFYGEATKRIHSLVRKSKTIRSMIMLCCQKSSRLCNSFSVPTATRFS